MKALEYGIVGVNKLLVYKDSTTAEVHIFFYKSGTWANPTCWVMGQSGTV